jgi:hypothetical protein
MNFFRTREVAESWVGAREDLAVLSVADADRLAQHHWVERARRADAAESAPIRP